MERWKWKGDEKKGEKKVDRRSRKEGEKRGKNGKQERE